MVFLTHWKNANIPAFIFTFALLLLASAESLGAEKILIGKWRTDEYVLMEGNAIQRPISAGSILQFFENNVFVLMGPGKTSVGGKYTLQNNSELLFNLPVTALMRLALPDRSKIQRIQNQLIFRGQLKNDNSLVYTIDATYTLIDDFKEDATFPIPNLTGFTMQKKWDDTTIDPLWKDTHHVKYTNSTGDRIDKLVANQWIVKDGKAQADTSAKDSMVWAWIVISKDVKSNPDDLTKNYKIVDTNCNGTFDRRYSLQNPTSIPECARWAALSKLMKE